MLADHASDATAMRAAISMRRRFFLSLLMAYSFLWRALIWIEVDESQPLACLSSYVPA
jgi:hypothetical protein